MCGIVGYIGNKQAKPILLTGLTNLEYRGYDSAGITIINKNKKEIIKDEGRVKHLIDLVKDNPTEAKIGIAHTRWATHGKPSQKNSHPHLDNSNTFAVVHNGIIENYNELKSFLIQKNYHFISETDTEIIPNLIHYFYNQNNDFLHSVYLTCKKLTGSYAISVICNKEPDKIIVAKKDSPLIIGKGENEYYISSDIPAILSYTNNFYFMNDLEYAEITKDNINFHDKNLLQINKELKTIDLDNNAAQKNGYDDFMLKEIKEQSNSIYQTIQDFEFDYNLIQNINKIYIVACGTAMHAGLVRQTPD